MTNNFLITLRNDTGCGCPGIGFGTTGYIEIPETNTNYDVQATMDPQQWLDDISDTSVLVSFMVSATTPARSSTGTTPSSPTSRPASPLSASIGRVETPACRHTRTTSIMPRAARRISLETA